MNWAQGGFSTLICDRQRRSKPNYMSRVNIKHHASDSHMSTAETNTWGIQEIVLGDTVSAWRSAGYNVDTEKTVDMNNVRIRLTEQGGGLLGIVFGAPIEMGISTSIQLPPVITGLSTFVEACRPEGAKAPSHPNACKQLGELVLYAQDLYGFVRQFESVGLFTHEHKPPKLFRGGVYAVAKFYLSNNLRLLVFGPTDLRHDSSKNPQLWMLGRGLEGAKVELTGYLAICSNLKLLRGSLNGKIGVTKKAVQKGRKIATLKRGTIHNLTGTFAFLSDGEGDLF